MNRLVRLFAGLMLTGLTVFVAATAQARENNAELRLLAGKTAAVPGETVPLVIEQTIRDGWHTYWTNPGDSGEPLSIVWSLPEGVSVSRIDFPVPYKKTYGPLTDYAYSGRVLYTADLAIAPDYAGETVTIRGEAFMLVCKDICIPEQADVTLTLPVASAAAPDHTGLLNEAQAAMPVSVSWPARVEREDGDTLLIVAVPDDLRNQMTDVDLFPLDWGVLENGATAEADIGDDAITFRQKAGSRSLLELPETGFIIKTADAAYAVRADTVLATGMGDAMPLHLPLILVMAFLGGIILNLMPCVFPVLSMKALSLVKLSDKERAHARISGLAYTAGILVSFMIVAGLLHMLKGAGEQIGWGFQLQNPVIVFALFLLLVAIGLNLLGVFQIGGRFVSLGAKMTSGRDVRASFFTGVLAMLVATPCTAPFMATAVGFALTQSAVISLAVFLFLGLGLAFPYLLLCFVPQVQKILPRPGPWMDTFKKILSVPMFLSALWLLWVFAQQINVIDRPQTDATPFTEAGFEELLEDNPDNPVFVNMTAAWCITCLVNERTSLAVDSVREAFEANSVIYVKGDWTNRDADITRYLESFERNGVPLYAYYGAEDAKGIRPDPILLPQILSPDIIISTIEGDKP